MKLLSLATKRGQMVQIELSLCRVYWANKNLLVYLQLFLYILVEKVYHLLYMAVLENS